MNFPTRAILFLVLCGLVVFFLVREEGRGTFSDVNRHWIDWLLANSEQQIVEPSVTFLKIDEGTIEMFEAEGALGPLDYALLCDKLAAYTPKVAAIEPVLSWDDQPELLLNSLKDKALGLDSLLLGCELEDNPAGEKISGSVLDLFPSIESVKGDLTKIPEFTGARTLPDLTLRIIGNLGFTRIDLAETGGHRSDVLLAPMLAIHKDRVVPSFVLQAVMLESDVAAGDVRVVLGEAIFLGDKLRVPVDESGRLTVFTKLRDALPVHDADILIPDPDEVEEEGTGQVELSDEEREALNQRVVLIGRNDEPAKSIPFGSDKISSAELSALAIATVQSGRYIRKLTPVQQFTVWGALAAIGLLVLNCAGGRARLLTLLLIVLFFAASIIAFKMGQHWQPLVIPAGILFCILASSLLPRKNPDTPEMEPAS